MLVGIIGAMHEEVIQLKNSMSIGDTKEVGGYKFYIGTLFDKNIVLVECGIGKVNASVCATLLITEFKVEKVLFTGVAGGINPKIDIGDIVISTDVIEHDFDCTSFGYELGIIPRMETSKFKADNNLLEIAKKVAINKFGSEKVHAGTILSGDIFVASTEKINQLREFFKGECTEMEGAAVGHVCYLLNKPFIIIRSISDKANSNAHINFDEFVKIAAQNSKIIIEGILEKL